MLPIPYNNIFIIILYQNNYILNQDSEFNLLMGKNLQIIRFNLEKDWKRRKKNIYIKPIIPII